MAKIKNAFVRVDTVLVADVADSGTFTVAYPSGTSQLTFTPNQFGTGHYMTVNDNDKWTLAASKMSLAFGASLITVTNSTGATLAAGSTVSIFVDQVDGNEVVLLTLGTIDLASITAADVMTEIRPGIAGTIEDFFFVVDKAVTTASKLASLNLEIDTTNVTGGVIALTSALATPKGAVISGSLITANNVLTKESKLSVEAASVTAFSEGTGTLYVRVRKTLSDIY